MSLAACADGSELRETSGFDVSFEAVRNPGSGSVTVTTHIDCWAVGPDEATGLPGRCPTSDWCLVLQWFDAAAVSPAPVEGEEPLRFDVPLDDVEFDEEWRAAANVCTYRRSLDDGERLSLVRGAYVRTPLPESSLIDARLRRFRSELSSEAGAPEPVEVLRAIFPSPSELGERVMFRPSR